MADSVLALPDDLVAWIAETAGGGVTATKLPLGRPVRKITKLRRIPVEEFTTVDSFAGPTLGPQG